MTILSVEFQMRYPDIDMDIALAATAGETLAIVGPSGSGKTTTLSVVAGLIYPQSGHVALGNRTLLDTASRIDVLPQKRRIGLVFQDYALFPHMTALQNVAYGVPGGKSERAKRAAMWLERFGLRAVADQRIGNLSGGQQQRVALARALAANPEALLLDEPLAALDVSIRSSVRSELKQHLDQLEMPTVFVTHDPVDALLFGQRLAVIEDGKVTQFGYREELIERPKTAFIAELTGLNLVRAVIDTGSGVKTARVGDVAFHVIADDIVGEAFLSFGASDVTLSASAPSTSAQNSFPMTVRAILPFGDTARILLAGPVALTALVTRDAVRALAIEPGSAVWASVKATAIRTYC